jgi:predicted AAA+ superfamily ATPase
MDYPRLLAPPRRSSFLFGPRGTGKSSWARAHFASAARFDLLDEALYHRLLAGPGEFADELRDLAPGSWVVVDEIQRLPGLLNEVHRFIEDRRLKFLMLGSSARKLKTAGTNLLAGRAGALELHPFVPAELGRDFDLEQALRFGTLPLVWSSDDRRAALQAYVQMYLFQEVRAEALVRNLPGFVRFLPLAALFHGQTLNVSSLARDSGTARTTVTGYIEILEETLLARRLPAFEGRLRVREKKHPKLYWVDPGLARAARRQLGSVTQEERGFLLEGFVLTALHAHAGVSELFDELHYWSPAEAKLEVDFLLTRGRKHLALEVKSGKRVDPDMLAGLRAIDGLKGLERRILVHGGDRRMRSPDGIEMWPLAALFDSLETGALWP